MFLDRDGVINHDYGYVSQIDKFQFIDGVFDACKYFINLGYEIIIITNQSGIGRGYYSKDDFKNLTNWMIKEFNKKGIEILKVYFCPHSPTETCECRKPKIGMIQQSLNDFNIDLQNSWLIGDKKSDIETAINANISNKILISQYKKNSEFLNIASNLIDTINIIKN
ncbi:D-glycero-beta-D-manno-heptose 1,7-bisphosphate 7-phosphatase [Arcobacter suis]|uniref:D-glycero-beta-D-manno-heptose 1,7-bisphosphate 7-phosphatase n=1 Tax=Arcobacter suis TaxID=1278212 RepID=UPI0038B259D5